MGSVGKYFFIPKLPVVYGLLISYRSANVVWFGRITLRLLFLSTLLVQRLLSCLCKKMSFTWSFLVIDMRFPENSQVGKKPKAVLVIGVSDWNEL